MIYPVSYYFLPESWTLMIMLMMEIKKIGALTIGQSPRPDLVAPLVKLLPKNCQILEAGALDDLAAADMPVSDHKSYPLVTRLRDNTQVMVPERFLAPRLQKALQFLEKEGVMATLLLCAGTFPDLSGHWPLLKPFQLGHQLLLNLGIQNIGLITPVKEQEVPISQRWAAAGFKASVWTADLNQQDMQFREHLQMQIKMHDLQAIILDYVGHPPRVVKDLQGLSPIPIVDLGQLAITTLAALF